MLLSLHGRPIIEWVVKRLAKSKLLDEVVIAIPDSYENDLLESYLLKYKQKVFRGSETDVLGRFYKAAKQLDAEQVVRICADNPLLDPLEIDNLIKFYQDNNCDYAYNHIPKDNKYPDGLGAEMVSMDLLQLIQESAIEPHNREHIFTYITDNPDTYVIKTFDPENERLWHPELKFDVDTIEDYQYLHSKEYTIDIASKELVDLFIHT